VQIVYNTHKQEDNYFKLKREKHENCFIFRETHRVTSTNDILIETLVDGRPTPKAAQYSCHKLTGVIYFKSVIIE